MTSGPPSVPSEGDLTRTPAPAAVPDSPRRRALKIALLVFRYALIVAVVVFAVWYFVRMWDPVRSALLEMNGWWVGASFVVLLAGLMCNVVVWTTLLDGLGHPVPFVRGAQIMLVGQLGKYVPGSVWAYVLQMELGRQYGIARARVLVTSLYAAGIGVVCSLVIGAVALPQIAAGHEQLLWLFALLPVGLVCLLPPVMTFLANLALRIFRRPPLEHRVRARTIVLAVAWCLASYLLYGVHLWLLTDGSVSPMYIVVMSAALSLGFTAGLFAFVLPSGVGVREAVLIGILGLTLSAGEASAISLVSRGMFTVGDLLTAGVAALAAFAMRRRLHNADIRSTEYADV
ncbi:MULTISPECIES: lysylphosphatidylglycerol synthase transmembrane domain-containing protein [Microbacterium]|uniref:Lysylphosphatidylglycerol synthase transmembrane domain-containing protein n=1 Tax=Microbacterium schleiferi TaxID=69362 RepID=A0ABU7V459_9MICO|nr:lysylphosphatidylglycerol synthase transmembrane domain-containing protein [Microbacterium sp. 67-17]